MRSVIEYYVYICIIFIMIDGLICGVFLYYFLFFLVFIFGKFYIDFREKEGSLFSNLRNVLVVLFLVCKLEKLGCLFYWGN